MLYVSHGGEITHMDRKRMVAIADIEQRCNRNLRLIDGAQRRDKFTDDELASMRRDIHAMQYNVSLNRIILEAKGIEAPKRDHLFRSGQTPAQGCFVTHNSARPQLFLYGAFGGGFGEISGAEIQNHLRDIGSDEDIDVRVNSPGGDVGEVEIICNALRERRGKTRGIVDGVAASGASIILMECNPIGIRRGGRIMVHFARVTSGLSGPQTAKDLETALRKVRAVDRNIASSYTHRWRGTAEELVAAMEDEKDFFDEDAVVWGLCDYVDQEASIATEADIEAAGAKQNCNPSNVLDRRNFPKYRTVFKQFGVAARYMPFDSETLMESIRRRERAKG